jgi:hypothetical protein
MLDRELAHIEGTLGRRRGCGVENLTVALAWRLLPCLRTKLDAAERGADALRGQRDAPA